MKRVNIKIDNGDNFFSEKNNIAFVSNLDSSNSTYDTQTHRIKDINIPYLTFLKNKISSDAISSNNIFFYKTSNSIKMYAKDSDNNLYPINIPTPVIDNDKGISPDGISGTALEPLLYNIFINKFLDYAVSDIFKKTYIGEESEAANTPTANSEE